MLTSAPSRCLFLCLFLGPWLATGVAAQEEATAFDIRLANPGARSLGFGGAFVALADDATATYGNPAGLTQLLEPELTLEIRVQSIEEMDGGLRDGLSISSQEEVTGLAFLAFVYPWKKISLAAYRNGFANLTFGTRVFGASGPRTFDIRASNAFELQTVGLSGSYRWSEDLSLGVGVARWEGSLTSERLSTLSGDPVAADEVRFTRITTSDDTDLTFNAGFLWRFATQWRLGGVYRGGPEFGQVSESRRGPATVPLEQLPGRSQQFSFLLPDVFGLGLAFKSKSENLTLSFEWDLVRYSRLLDSLRGTDRRSFDLDDGHELHLGCEYVIIRSRPVLALRLGVWREPDHLLRYSGDDPIDRATFRGGESETHFAAGLGMAFRSLKLDFAFDAASSVDTGSFTLIYSF